MKFIHIKMESCLISPSLKIATTKLADLLLDCTCLGGGQMRLRDESC